MLLDGVDQEDKLWIYRRQSGDYTCTFCGVPVKEGWFCFDNGSTVCAQHVSIKGEMGPVKSA